MFTYAKVFSNDNRATFSEKGETLYAPLFIKETQELGDPVIPEEEAKFISLFKEMDSLKIKIEELTLTINKMKENLLKIPVCQELKEYQIQENV